MLISLFKNKYVEEVKYGIVNFYLSLFLVISYMYWNIDLNINYFIILDFIASTFTNFPKKKKKNNLPRGGLFVML